MKCHPIAVTALFSLLAPVAMADFDVWMSNDVPKRWSFWQSGPDGCVNIQDGPYQVQRKDVSGYKFGVRCKGDGCGEHGHPTEIEELEMNLQTGDDKAMHTTIYKNRDWGLFGTDDNYMGRCEPAQMNPGDTVECALGFVAVKKFYCKSDKLDHNTIFDPIED